MHEVVRWLEYVNLVSFTGLALIAVRLWARRRDAATFSAMLAFGALAVVSIAGRLLPDHPSPLVEHTVTRFDVAMLLVFPYLTYRFTTAFDPPSRRVADLCNAMTTVMVAATFAVPHFPDENERWGFLFSVYVAGFLVHWTVLSFLTARRLWVAGRRLPGVARKRMRLLAGAAGALTVAIFMSAAAGDAGDGFHAATQLVGLGAAVAFAVALAPPALLRVVWRQAEARRLQDAVTGLVTLATTREEVVDRVLPPMAAIVGAQAVVVRDADGNELGGHRRPGDDAPTQRVDVPVPGGSVSVWTTPYAPFFGDEELQLVRTLGALTALALDRVRLFTDERDARLALERANRVMADFVALAAHELRTPVTTIHGFVHTLNHLGDRLAPEQRGELNAMLERQTERMKSLVEQLLDLSRLDAQAIEIAPERFRVRDRVAEIVETTAGEHAPSVEVRVDDALEAEADPNAFDRIVANLVANAIRYGDPPVVVSAVASDNHFRVVVEDRGHGVPEDFVPDLFERFSRSRGSRERAPGTGLGLAIARSFARAHGGDLVYEPAEPSGARFQLVLPARQRPR